MGSSRRTGTNEDIETLGDETRDHTLPDTFEALYDIDTTAATGDATTHVLEMYDDGAPYDWIMDVNGGTHDQTYPLIFRAARGHKNRFSKTTGVRIEDTSAGTATISVNDDFVYIFDIGIKTTRAVAGTFRGILLAANNGIVAGCFFYDGTNSVGDHRSDIEITGNNCVVVNSGSLDSEGNLARTSGTSNVIYSCTTRNNNNSGFRDLGTTSIIKNCLGDGTLLDFTGAFPTASHNASSDGSAPGSNNRINQTFVFASATDSHLSATDLGAKTFGADLSNDPVFDFDDDVDEQRRGDVWDIGADQSVSGDGLMAVSGIIDLTTVRG